MEQDFVALLLADTAIANLVLTRINWVVAEQGGARPNIILTRVSGVRDYTFQGQDDLVSSRVQIDCYALTYAGVKDVARAVIAKVSGIHITQGATKFELIEVDNERDLFEADSTTDKLFRVSIDAMILHK